MAFVDFGKFTLVTMAGVGLAVALHSTTGTPHKLLFGASNLAMLLYWFNAISNAQENKLKQWSMPSVSMIVFGLMLVVVVVLGEQERDFFVYIPYGLLIVLVGSVFGAFGSLNPSDVYAPGGYFDNHPVLSLAFSGGLMLGVLGLGLFCVVLLWE